MFSWMLGLSYWRLMRTTCRSHAFSRKLLSRDVMPAPRLKEPQAVPCLQGALEVPLLSPTHESNIGLSFTQQEGRPPLGPVMFHLSVEDTASIGVLNCNGLQPGSKERARPVPPQRGQYNARTPWVVADGRHWNPSDDSFSQCFDLVKDWTALTVYSWIEHN